MSGSLTDVPSPVLSVSCSAGRGGGIPAVTVPLFYGLCPEKSVVDRELLKTIEKSREMRRRLREVSANHSQALIFIDHASRKTM